MTQFLPILLLTSLFHLSTAEASERLKTTQLSDMTYEEMKTLVRNKTSACFAAANSAEKASATSLEDIDQYVGEEQSPELALCLTRVSGLILSRREQNDRVPELFQKSLVEINEDYRKTAHKTILESAIVEYKLLRQKMRDANASMRKTLIADLATSYEQILNTLSEVRPLLKSNKNEARPLFEMVSKADIAPESELKSFRNQHGASYTPDLSLRAREILASAE
jgi:hypothetical protein